MYVDIKSLLEIFSKGLLTNSFVESQRFTILYLVFNTLKIATVVQTEEECAYVSFRRASTSLTDFQASLSNLLTHVDSTVNACHIIFSPY